MIAYISPEHGAYVPLVIFIGAVVICNSCYYIKFIIKKSTLFIYKWYYQEKVIQNKNKGTK